MRRSHSHSFVGRFASFLGACASVEIDLDPPAVCCALPPLRVIVAALSTVPLRMAWKKAVHVMVCSLVRRYILFLTDGSFSGTNAVPNGTTVFVTRLDTIFRVRVQKANLQIEHHNL
jgi:hypothetical protein